MSHYLKYFATVYLTLVLLVGIFIYVFNLGAILLIPALIASALLSKRKANWSGALLSLL